MMTKPKDPKPPATNDFVYQFAVSKGSGAKKARCYAARLSGLYCSSDGGRTWRGAFTSLNLREPLSALAVAVPPDPEDEQAVFVGVHGGVLRSSDGGQTWVSTLRASPPPTATSLAISPNFLQDGTLFAGSLEDGVFRSSDRGWKWAAWNFGLMDLRVLCLAISPDFAVDEMLVAGTQSGLFRSTNGGRAWREVELPGGFQSVLSVSFSPGFAQNATVFAGTEKRGLLRSTDGGRTWVRVGRPALSGPINGIYLGARSSRKAALLVLEGGTPMTSQDGGATWKVWKKAKLARKDIAAVYAPEGFGPKALVLVGHMDGTVVRL